jgi:hypothetical protein
MGTTIVGCGNRLGITRFVLETVEVSSDRLMFTIMLFTSESRERTYTLHCSPGNNTEPVLTIMRIDED